LVLRIRDNPRVADGRTDADRMARNEALFRQVNERVRDVSQAFATLDSTPVGFVCECGRQDCTERVPLRLQEYEAVRAEPIRFFVIRGHADAAVDRIVEDHGSYVVVEKLPHEQDVARDTDPRS
jgi:hypothetical protein